MFITSTPQPVLTTNATATTPAPIDPEVPSAAGITTPQISVYGVTLVALLSTLVHLKTSIEINRSQDKTLFL